MNKQKILFIVLWILSLVGISFYGGTISYGFFFALTLLPFLCLIYLVLVYFRFRIYQEMEGRTVVSGEPAKYFFVLHNEDYFTFSGIRIHFFSSFSTVEKLPDNSEFEMLPGDRITHETKICCKYRGEYEVGVKELVITDFLGLFTFKYALPNTLRAIVLPKVAEITELESIRDLHVNLQREAYRAETEPDSVVRDYVPGDPRKQIHWRASAKGQGLKVRGLIGEEKQGMAIVFDTGRYSEHMHEYLPAENKVLEVVLALGFFLAKKNIPFVTACLQEQAGRGSSLLENHVGGIREFERFYEATSEIMFAGERICAKTFGELLGRSQYLSCRILFLVAQKVDGEILQLTEEFGKHGQLVVLYVIGEEDEDIEKESNERRRIVCIDPNAELKEGL